MEIVRERYGGVRRRLALALGKNASQVNRYFNKGVIPSGAELAQIAKVTGYSLDWLLLGQLPKRRGAVPSSTDLGARLRAYMIGSDILADLVVEGTEVAFHVGVGEPLTRQRAVAPFADLLPAMDEELLGRTAMLWFAEVRDEANQRIVREAWNRAASANMGRGRAGRDPLLFDEIYSRIQAAVTDQSQLDSKLRGMLVSK